MILYLIVLVLLTAVAARWARKQLQRDKARLKRRWQIFVPRAHVTRLERDLSGYSVEIRALPSLSPNERQMLVIDTAKLSSFLPQPAVSVEYDAGIVNQNIVVGESYSGTPLTALIKDPDERRAREVLDAWQIFEARQPKLTVTIKDPNPEWFDTMLGREWWYQRVAQIQRPEFSLMITGVV